MSKFSNYDIIRSPVVTENDVRAGMATRSPGPSVRFCSPAVGEADAAAAPPGVDAVWPPERLHDLLAQSDVIVLALPHTPQTRRLIARPELDALVLARVREAERRADGDGLVCGLDPRRAVRIDAAARLPLKRLEPLPPVLATDVAWHARTLGSRP